MYLRSWLSLAACLAGLCLWVPQSSATWPSWWAVLVGWPQSWYAPSCQQGAKIPCRPYERTGICGLASCRVTEGSPLVWVCLQLSCLREGCGEGTTWSSKSVCQPDSSSLPMLVLPERGQQENAVDVLMKHGRAGASLVCSVLSGVGEHYPNLIRHLSSLFCGITTWGLSGQRPLLRLPSWPQAPFQRICASVSLHYC